MSKYILSFMLIVLLLCACSNQMPSAESEVNITTSPTVRPNSNALPTISNPAHESEQQADMVNPIEISISDVPAYGAIVDYYRSFMYRDEATDIEIEINNLYDNIALEISLNDERKKYEFWCSCIETRNSKLGYAIHDINYDVVPELIILSDDYFIHAIYSLQDDAPILVGGYWSRHSCTVDKGGVLYISASGGASDSYSASYTLTSDNELHLIEMVGIESYDEQAEEKLPEPRCYRVFNGNKTIIDYEEAQIFWGNSLDTYSNNTTEDIGLLVIPLSD